MNWSKTFIGFLSATAAFGEKVYPIGNMLKPRSTPADSIFNISMLMLAVCAGIFVAVADLLAFTIVRFRRRGMHDRREPVQIYGSNRIEIAWTVIPVLIVLAAPGMATARTAVEDQPPRREDRNSALSWSWPGRRPALALGILPPRKPGKQKMIVLCADANGKDSDAEENRGRHSGHHGKRALL